MAGILIVTGGGRGIGAETAILAARAGWDVWRILVRVALRAEVEEDLADRGLEAAHVLEDVPAPVRGLLQRGVGDGQGGLCDLQALKLTLDEL